ncbi:hypothetical protein KEM52_006462, partial [Ascosphaera acerosa]
MPPHIPSARATLAVPLMAADFHPLDDRYLVVGGGGGEGRSGVGNRIILLDTSDSAQLAPVVELELSRDEDSVTSLAVAQSRTPGSPEDHHLVVFAGVNSSQAEQDKGNNEHLRSYRLCAGANGPRGPSPPAVVDGGAATISKASLFRPGPARAGVPREAYQKLLRLSPPRSVDGALASDRIGVASTGMEEMGEIIAFAVRSEEVPRESDVLARVRLGDGQEAEDVDIAVLDHESGSLRARVAFTDGLSVCTFDLPSPGTATATTDPATLSTPEPTPIYTTSHEQKGSRVRAVRFLNPTALVMLRNLPGRSGCELVLLVDGTVASRKRLRKDMKMGLGLDVASLPVDPATGARQHVVAVSGSNHALDIFTVDDRGDGAGDRKRRYSSFKRYTTIRDVHGFTITKITLSSAPPTTPSPSHHQEQQEKKAASTRQTAATSARPYHPSVKLASVSVGNTVAPYPSRREPRRYVLTAPTTPSADVALATLWSVCALLVVVVSAMLLQAVSEIRGSAPPVLHAREWLAPRLQAVLPSPYFGVSVAGGEGGGGDSRRVHGMGGAYPTYETTSSSLISTSHFLPPSPPSSPPHSTIDAATLPAFEPTIVATDSVAFDTYDTALVEEAPSSASTVPGGVESSTSAVLPGADEPAPGGFVGDPYLTADHLAPEQSDDDDEVGLSDNEPVKGAKGPQGSAREQNYLD